MSVSPVIFRGRGGGRPKDRLLNKVCVLYRENKLGNGQGPCLRLRLASDRFDFLSEGVAF